MKSGAGVDESWAAWLREMGIVALFTGASTVVMGTLPLLNGLFSEHLQLDWRDLGWLGAASQAGTLVGTLLGYWVTTRGSFRVGIQLAAAGAIVAWLIAGTADALPQLVVGRTVTSIGLGCIFSIGTYALAHSASPARGFSVMSAVQIACGSLHTACLPWIHFRLGYSAAVASIAFWFLMILLLGRYAQLGGVATRDAVGRRRAQGAARFIGAELLLSVMAFQMAVTTFWAYSERIASASGLPEEEIATAIAIGNLGGIPAAILGAWAGRRFGYIPLLLLATIAAVGGEFIMSGARTEGVYLAGQFIFNFGWILGISYYLALLASRAADSRMIQIAPVALVIASAMGPLSVALLKTSSSSTLVTLALLLCCGALLPAMFRRGHS